MSNQIYRSNLRSGILFSLPWIIGFLLFILYPIVQSLYYSFTDFNLFQLPDFVGLENYKSIFTEDLFYKSLGNTLFMTLVGSPIYIIIGLIMAVLLNNKLKGLALFRTIFYIPYILPICSDSSTMDLGFKPVSGLLNMFLKTIHLPAPNWLADPSYTKISLIFIGAWRDGSHNDSFPGHSSGYTQDLL